MSYEPTTWVNGDIITATKLNNIESGVQSVNNSYTPTTWVNGDIITATKLNNIEQGIANAGGGSSDFSTAEVTVTCNASNEVQLLLAIAEEANPPFVPTPRTVGAYYVYNGDTITLTAILYNGRCDCNIVGVVNTSGTGSINILDDNYAIITGDCTITIS